MAPILPMMVFFFHYSDPAQVLSIEPATGSIDGGTTVSINGRNFNQSGAHLCRFGDNTPPVPANFVSSSKIVCLSPSNEPGASTVEVSDNGADYTTSFVQFTYRLPIRVSSVYPSSGPETGNTVVRVVGANFADVIDLRCSFEGEGEIGTSANASYVSSGLLECISPGLVPGKYSIRISGNGVDFSKEYAYFSVYPLHSSIASARREEYLKVAPW